MLEFSPYLSNGRKLKILCIGAHCDDVEIGCGATLNSLCDTGWLKQVDWVILSGSDIRREEATRAMRSLISDTIRGDLVFGNFRDGRMPADYLEIKEFFEEISDRFSPDLLFTHERDDRHQDHRVVNEMTWNTFRDHCIMEFEVPKWDGGLGQPNMYMPVSQHHADKKIETLLGCYKSQSEREWFTRSTFEALLRIRGIESRSPTGWAEAFHARKIRIAP